MKLSTINVVEKVEYDDPTIHAFPRTPEGRAEAINLFKQIGRDQEGYFSEAEIEVGVDAGFLVNEDGTWNVSLIDSES